MSYKIDKQSLIYKTLELNERFLVGGDNEGEHTMKRKRRATSTI